MYVLRVISPIKRIHVQMSTCIGQLKDQIISGGKIFYTLTVNCVK